MITKVNMMHADHIRYQIYMTAAAEAMKNISGVFARPDFKEPHGKFNKQHHLWLQIETGIVANLAINYGRHNDYAQDFLGNMLGILLLDGDKETITSLHDNLKEDLPQAWITLPHNIKLYPKSTYRGSQLVLESFEEALQSDGDPKYKNHVLKPSFYL